MHSQIMKLALLCFVAAVSAAPSRSSRFLFFNPMFPFHRQQQHQSSFFYKMPQIFPPLIHPHHSPHPDPVDPLPYTDYPVELPPPPPQPEPEPILTSYSGYNFQDNQQHFHPLEENHHFLPPAGNNLMRTPSDQLEPPRAPTKGPFRVFFLFSRFPWPLEPAVQRVQNYFSTYTVPTVEPILDTEIDLGPPIEDVDEFEAQLALIGLSTTPKPSAVQTMSVSLMQKPAVQTIVSTTQKPALSTTEKSAVPPVQLVDKIKPLILADKNETESAKGEEVTTEILDDDSTEATTTEASDLEEATTTENAKDDITTTTMPISGSKNEKITSAVEGKMLEDALRSHVLDYEEIFMTS